MSLAATKQRSDYTFKFNRDVARHGWLRLTPAYSVKLVEEILEGIPEPSDVLDPFSGTATTPLCASYHGHRAVGHELNPFLVWLGTAKVRRYSDKDIHEAERAVTEIIDCFTKRNLDPVAPPPIHNIDRWWRSDRLSFLCELMGAIHRVCSKPSASKDVLLIAFCRVMIDLSNAAFNHQSMSFKTQKSEDHPELFTLDLDYPRIFAKEALKVIASACVSPLRHATIVMGDSRTLSDLSDQRFDLLITSPPYPNRMSYIRELRPYMYWLGYLEEAREAGELDWEAIGGTWGIATSRLNEWEPTANGFCPPYFEDIIKAIATGDGKNGELLSRYVAKYFQDMFVHLRNVRELMREGGQLHYIIGNSVFYGTVVPVERIYADMLKHLGFRDVDIKTIRKRNSKKALYEFDVSARR